MTGSQCNDIWKHVHHISNWFQMNRSLGIRMIAVISRKCKYNLRFSITAKSPTSNNNPWWKVIFLWKGHLWKYRLHGMKISNAISLTSQLFLLISSEIKPRKKCFFTNGSKCDQFWTWHRLHSASSFFYRQYLDTPASQMFQMSNITNTWIVSPTQWQLNGEQSCWSLLLLNVSPDLTSQQCLKLCSDILYP